MLTGTEKTSFNWTIYTGDLLSHDPFNQLSRYVPCYVVEHNPDTHREYTLYAEVNALPSPDVTAHEMNQTLLYDLMKRTVNTGPVYAALGNHDTYMA